MTYHACCRCLKPMKRNRWGWFDHVRPSSCDCQHAEYIEEEPEDIFDPELD